MHTYSEIAGYHLTYTHAYKHTYIIHTHIFRQHTCIHTCTYIQNDSWACIICVAFRQVYYCLRKRKYKCVGKHQQTRYVCMYACMRVCVYACVHLCMYACIHAYMHACMYVCIYIHTCMCLTRL